ncbi:thyrotropin receptor-like isoform X3 [Lethenteron reissneri]|uniref:thyrotropin receptor-like isoform X3 n=1 Tax=Lethenteron reissneri TaxID=7753 RepID=UPI002AB6BCAB|nr:thyrotropin receptor-like isoform X3 [Lethenteron reissneri]
MWVGVSALTPPLLLLLLHVVACQSWLCPANCRCLEQRVECVGMRNLDIPSPLPRDSIFLRFMDTMIEEIPGGAFSDLPNITKIFFSIATQLRHVQANAFSNLVELKYLEIKHAKNLTHIHPLALQNLPNLKYLTITNTGISSFPNLRWVRSTIMGFILEMADNLNMPLIPANAFEGLSSDTLILRLYNNGIREVKSHAFNGSRLHRVELYRNEHLQKLDNNAFAGVLRSPDYLDVSWTAIESLPSQGLDNLRILRAEAATRLKHLPPTSVLKALLNTSLTYPSHCCAFRGMKRQLGRSLELHCNQTTMYRSRIRRAAALTPGKAPPLGIDANGSSGEAWSSGEDDRSAQSGHYYLPFLEEPEDTNVGFGEQIRVTKSKGSATFEHSYGGDPFEFCIPRDITCLPKPDAFNPCEDIMGDEFLRMSIWFVSLLAIVGNLFVLLIILTSHYKPTVPRFLMCNLAFADLCMGIYLLIIAGFDLYSRSEFYNHAIDWQTGPGCNIAGFVSVFASELSVYTLMVITVERWHAITFAMRLDRKIRFRQALGVMAGGWLFSVVLAGMPLYGVSSYSKDTKIAKRMAILIFTDFICMAPISFFAISAAFKLPLITVSHSKILVVVFYPLNSCANPFLYAVFTKTFRRDFFILLSRLGFCEARAQLYRGQTALSVHPSGVRNGSWTSSHRGSGGTVYTLVALNGRDGAAGKGGGGGGEVPGVVPPCAANPGTCVRCAL